MKSERNNFLFASKVLAKNIDFLNNIFARANFFTYVYDSEISPGQYFAVSSFHPVNLRGKQYSFRFDDKTRCSSKNSVSRIGTYDRKYAINCYAGISARYQTRRRSLKTRARLHTRSERARKRERERENDCIIHETRKSTSCFFFFLLRHV